MAADRPRPRRASGVETRRRLLDHGACLFARHGVDGVEIQAIQDAAGTKNQRAVHYYFGDRQGLLRAIIERHLTEAERLRRPLVEQIEADGATDDLDRLLDALITPMTCVFGSAVGRAELRLAAQLNHPDLAYSLRPFSLVDAPSGTRLVDMLRRAAPSVPEPIERERFAILREQVIHLVGQRARLIDHREPPEPDHTDAIWQSNLIDVLAAGLTVPVTDRTRKLLGVDRPAASDSSRRR